MKLFDFGLAKELDSRQKNASNGLYEMSGGTGSRRYMAPEVSRSESYTLSADLYSYGIVLWEVLTFEKAFWNMTLEEHTAKIVQGEERPKLLTRKWSNTVQSLLQGCWHKDPSQRPSAKQVHKILLQELDAYSSHHNLRLQISRRGSV